MDTTDENEDTSFQMYALNTAYNDDGSGTGDGSGDGYGGGSVDGYGGGSGDGSGVGGGASSRSVETYDATAVFYVKLNDMHSVFRFKRPTIENNQSLSDAISDASSNIRYFVFRNSWPTSLKINPSHAMLDRADSSGQLLGGGGNTYDSNKSLVKHDFLRYLALHLFNTVHGVDLFQNESDLLENLAYYGEVARVGIHAVLDTISTMSADITMNMDNSGNKYLTNTNTTISNISRELMRQIALNVPARLQDSGVAESTGIQSVPLVENDTLNIKVMVEAAPNQHTLTNVNAIPVRSYNIKLILKNAVDVSGANTVVSDSVLFPNAYPYSSNVLDLPANTEAAASVYADASPPVTIPYIRYGYSGWYYTNSDSWVAASPTVRSKINWYLPPNNNTVTVGGLRYIRLSLRVFNCISTPFITIYTTATGSGDAGGWYKSKRTYVISDSGSLTNNTNYCFYFQWNGYSMAPFVVGHTNSVLSLSTVAGSEQGAFQTGEVILAYTIGTNSSSARGNVEFILSSAVIGESSGGGGGGGGGAILEKEYGFIP